MKSGVVAGFEDRMLTLLEGFDKRSVLARFACLRQGRQQTIEVSWDVVVGHDSSESEVSIEGKIVLQNGALVSFKVHFRMNDA